MPDAEPPVGPQKIHVAMICPHCEQPSIQEVSGTAEITRNPDPDDPDPYLDTDSVYRLLQCTNCEAVSLQLEESSLFDDVTSQKVLYPARRDLSLLVPDDLRREFEEARTCFSSKAYTATVVMVRRTLEGICKANNIAERTLEKSLEKLKSSGLIDGSLAEWADSLRALGNEGAHFTGKRVSRQDAVDALDFTEALLDQIYVLRKRFAEFKRRRDHGALPPRRPSPPSYKGPSSLPAPLRRPSPLPEAGPSAIPVPPRPKSPSRAESPASPAPPSAPASEASHSDEVQ
jgi:hypothetical protein